VLWKKLSVTLFWVATEILLLHSIICNVTDGKQEIFENRLNKSKGSTQLLSQKIITLAIMIYHLRTVSRRNDMKFIMAI